MAPRSVRRTVGDVDGSSAVEATPVESDTVTAVFAALADPARRRILAVLGGGQRCVCDIQAELPIAANLLSYHLRVLREAGLIEGSKRGRWVDYRLTGQAGTVVADALTAAGVASATAAALTVEAAR